jgi:hypothetical protein
MSALMWEAKAVAAHAEELLAWALDVAAPEADVYRSADARVVVIDPTGRGLPEAPGQWLARPAHSWSFERVARSRP